MSKPVQSEIDRIRERLGHHILKWAPAAWLDTGFPELNAVLGHHEKGLTYAEILEISGENSTAKTALALSLAALAQNDGAVVHWVNLEGGRFDFDWAHQRGIDTENGFNLIESYVGNFGDEKEPRLASAQELCAEAESLIKSDKSKKYKKQILVIDSVAAMLTEYENLAGVEDQNMRSNMSLPAFLSKLLRRWVGLAQSYNVLMVMLNQLRKKPQAFGDPWYTPGGEALQFYAHARVRMRRTKGGKITQSGHQIGIQGVIHNRKNKLGGFEGAQIGFKMRFTGPLEFLRVEDIKAEG